jgi:soluble lytic murein transglycosylase-like protein
VATGDWERALARCGVGGAGKLPYRPNWNGLKRYAPAIREAASRHALDPALVAAVIAAESNFNPRARSPAGAAGLMQLMPGTAARYGVADRRLDPDASIAGGTQYLRFLLDTFDGDVSLALAGYNAGEGAVIQHGRQIPPYRETRAYVPRVLAFYRLFQERGLPRTQIRGVG